MRKIHAKGQALKSHYRRLPTCDGPLMLQEKSRESALWVSFLPAIVPKTDQALNCTDFLFASEMLHFGMLIGMSGTTVVWHSKACLKTFEGKKWSDLMTIRNETKQDAWWRSKMTALNSNWQVVKRDSMGLCAMGMVPCIKSWPRVDILDLVTSETVIMQPLPAWHTRGCRSSKCTGLCRRITEGAVTSIRNRPNTHKGWTQHHLCQFPNRQTHSQTAQHQPPKSILTASSSFWVSSSILLMSSIVNSIHLSIQQNSWRWKLVNILFSCFKRINKY